MTTRQTGSPDRSATERLWPWWLLTAAVLVAVWQFGSEVGFLSPRSFSTPSDVARSMWEWHASGESLPHLSFTLQAVVAGYVIGVVLGTLVASCFFIMPIVATIFDPFMAIVNGIPKVIIAPPMVLLLGLGLGSKVAVAVTLVFFLAFFNVLGGLRSVDRALIANLRVLGASRWKWVKDLYAPAMLAWTMATLRVGIGFAFAGVVVAEFMGSERGLGLTMKYAGERFDPALLMAGLLTLAIVVAIVDRFLVLVERHFSRWSMQ